MYMVNIYVRRKRLKILIGALITTYLFHNRMFLRLGKDYDLPF